MLVVLMLKKNTGLEEARTTALCSFSVSHHAPLVLFFFSMPLFLLVVMSRSIALELFTALPCQHCLDLSREA